MKEASVECLKRVEKALLEGKEGRAQELALRYFSTDHTDSELFYKWAQVFELLGMAKKAISAYGLALKFSPDNPRYLKPLAILFYETGKLKEAFGAFRRLKGLRPGDGQIDEYWHRILKELGFEGSIEEISEQPFRGQHLRYFPPSVGKNEARLFLHLFSGRHRGLFVQQRDKRTGLSRLVYQDICLDESLMKDHVLGEKTIFFLPLREDKKVKTAILAIFIPKRDLFYYARQPSFLEVKAESLKEFTLKSFNKICGWGLPAYLERVNRFFYRIWWFLEEFIHFLKVRRFLKEVITRLSLPHFGGRIEAYLPTKPIGVGWQERPMLLPLGIERQTGQRSLFIDGHGEAYSEQLRFLKRAKELPVAELKNFLRHFQQLKLEQTESLSKGQTPLLERLKQGCSIIKAILEKTEEGGPLSRNEKVVLFYTIGILDKELLHQVLYPLPDYNYHRVNRILKGLKPNPISCIKIRELLPELAHSLTCNCVFDLSDGRYPSPVMHINPVLVPTEIERFTLKRSSLQQLAQRFIWLWQERQRIEGQLRILENELKGGLKKKGWAEINVSGRRLCLKEGRLVVAGT